LYFGGSSRPLFGVLHEARGAPRRAGVVLCPPFGQEALRAHRSLRELAARLADAGFPVLRFDYSGSGDSAGEPGSARLEAWVEDAATAIEEVRESTGEARVVLAGLRLGAAIAALAARRAGGAAGLVLWEPVVDGAAHLAAMRAAHAAWMRDHAPGAALAPDEVLGIPLPPGLASDLAGLRLDCLPAPPARRTLVLGSAEDSAWRSLWENDAAVERRAVPRAPVWLHAEGMARALVPGALLDGVVEWLAGAVE
jgi:alpha/beta superfamily hydrolase